MSWRILALECGEGVPIVDAKAGKPGHVANAPVWPQCHGDQSGRSGLIVPRWASRDSRGNGTTSRPST
jgi:hypothetical protein